MQNIPNSYRGMRRSVSIGISDLYYTEYAKVFMTILSLTETSSLRQTQPIGESEKGDGSVPLLSII